MQAAYQKIDTEVQMKDAQAELNEEAALLKQAFAKPKDSPKKDAAAAGDGPSTSGRESAEPDEMVSGDGS